MVIAAQIDGIDAADDLAVGDAVVLIEVDLRLLGPIAKRGEGNQQLLLGRIVRLSKGQEGQAGQKRTNDENAHAEPSVTIRVYRDGGRASITAAAYSCRQRCRVYSPMAGAWQTSPIVRPAATMQSGVPQFLVDLF